MNNKELIELLKPFIKSKADLLPAHYDFAKAYAEYVSEF